MGKKAETSSMVPMPAVHAATVMITTPTTPPPQRSPAAGAVVCVGSAR
jgi:hypothetical protein